MMEKLRKTWFHSIAAASACVALSCTEAPPPGASANVVVDFPGTTLADPPLMLYSGREGADCERFQPYVANPPVTLDDVSYDPDCRVEIDAFTAGRGAYAVTIDPSVAGAEAWLVEAIESGSLSIALPGLTAVPLHIWLVATDAEMVEAKRIRDKQLDKAYPILETMGAGLTLDTLSSELDPDVVPNRCAEAGAIASTPAIYDASRINIYFLQNYAGILDLTPAYNCWQEGHPEIVFISWGNTKLKLPTLTHELGHALGLIHPTDVGGHTYFTPGFDIGNLMASNNDVTNISIGQLYALNFSSDSWLNRTDSPVVRPVVRACQNAWGDDGECPALTLFKSGWPP
jgi:hypothetical protein